MTIATTTTTTSTSNRNATNAGSPKRSASSKQAKSDSFYGHEDTAKMCARFITALFSCPDIPPPPANGPPPTNPPAALAPFIAYALHRTRLPPSVTFCALFLLSRLKGRFPAARGSSGHRLFISAFMIASKVVCDDTYSNKSWCVVGQGMFSLREINQMEREMCSYLEWVLNVKPEELSEFEAEVKRDYATGSPSTTTTTAASSTTPPKTTTSVPPLVRSATSSAPLVSRPVSAAPISSTAFSSPDSSPPSPSHSDSSSPTSSEPRTPPTPDVPAVTRTNAKASIVTSKPSVQVKVAEERLPGIKGSASPEDHQAFAFATPAEW